MGEWIALLDDDDEWLPQKLERQVASAGSEANVLVGCLSRVITPIATYVWPEQIYDGTVPLGDYLFDRRTVFAGSSFIQTSSELLRRATFRRCPFRLHTPHYDWEFFFCLGPLAGANHQDRSGGAVERVFRRAAPVTGERQCLAGLTDPGSRRWRRCCPVAPIAVSALA